MLREIDQTRVSKIAFGRETWRLERNDTPRELPQAPFAYAITRTADDPFRNGSSSVTGPTSRQRVAFARNTGAMLRAFANVRSTAFHDSAIFNLKWREIGRH